LLHASTCVQALPSLHADPSGFLGFEHDPVAGLHVPCSWHESGSAHTTAVPVHTPD
jgi:hypothetical protein